MKNLDKNQLSNILGGDNSACTASCGGGVVVTCSGENCVANDYSGCSSSEVTIPCPRKNNQQ